jgi:Kef-type K+ transport system membrane component KefB
MHEHHILVSFASLPMLLGSARGLGELARRFWLPLVFGELASGVLLGPSALVVPQAACDGHFEDYPALPIALLIGPERPST